jgi:hypothetical protein
LLWEKNAIDQWLFNGLVITTKKEYITNEIVTAAASYDIHFCSCTKYVDFMLKYRNSLFKLDRTYYSDKLFVVTSAIRDIFEANDIPLSVYQPVSIK